MKCSQEKVEQWAHGTGKESKTEKMDIEQNPTEDNLKFCRADWREVITAQTNPSG